MEKHRRAGSQTGNDGEMNEAERIVEDERKQEVGKWVQSVRELAVSSDPRGPAQTCVTVYNSVCRPAV